MPGLSRSNISVVKECNLKCHYITDMKLSMTLPEGKKLFIIRGLEIIV